MIEQFLKMGGFKNDASGRKKFLQKYPTEAAFFKAHPQAMNLVNNYETFMPSYNTMPQAMYGMGMARGGSYLPRAQNGIEVGDPTKPPRQQDFPDYESYAAAFDEWLNSLQQQADTQQVVPQGTTTNTATTPATTNSGNAVSAP